jgi:hypothetical protein
MQPISFLGQAVRSVFASLDQEEQAPVVRNGPLTAGFIAPLSTEDGPVSGPLFALAAAVNASPAVQENLEYRVCVNNFLRAQMALSQQCRSYDGSVLSEPHVIILNSPSSTDGIIRPGSEEADMINDDDGMVFDMEVFSRGIVSSLETPQESYETDNPSLQDFWIPWRAIVNADKSELICCCKVVYDKLCSNRSDFDARVVSLLQAMPCIELASASCMRTDRSLLFRFSKTTVLSNLNPNWYTRMMESRLVCSRFRQQEKIGSGSFGEIHSAEDVRTHECVAVKLENGWRRFDKSALN